MKEGQILVQIGTTFFTLHKAFQIKNVKHLKEVLDKFDVRILPPSEYQKKGVSSDGV